MSNRIVNLTAHAHAVPIVNSDTGEKREVFVQPSGKPKLPDGFVPDSTFLFRNPGFKVVSDAPADTPASVAQTVDTPAPSTTTP